MIHEEPVREENLASRVCVLMESTKCGYQNKEVQNVTTM